MSVKRVVGGVVVGIALGASTVVVSAAEDEVPPGKAAALAAAKVGSPELATSRPLSDDFRDRGSPSSIAEIKSAVPVLLALTAEVAALPSEPNRRRMELATTAKSRAQAMRAVRTGREVDRWTKDLEAGLLEVQ